MDKNAKYINKILKTSKFNFKRHTKIFTNECEAIILPTGKICYSIPSHTEQMIKLFCKQFNLSKDNALKELRQTDDPFKYLVDKLSCVVIWYHFCFHIHPLTQAQYKTIGKLLEYNCISDDLLNTL